MNLFSNQSIWQSLPRTLDFCIKYFPLWSWAIVQRHQSEDFKRLTDRVRGASQQLISQHAVTYTCRTVIRGYTTSWVTFWSKPLWSLMYFATWWQNIPPKLRVLLNLQLGSSVWNSQWEAAALGVCDALLQEWLRTRRETQGNSGYPSSQHCTALMRGLITQENGMPRET